MKKRLLFAAIAMVCSLGLFAQAQYVYTADGRYKLTGDNLITNGDFSEGNEGWTIGGETTFSIVEGEGPKGENVLSSSAATAGDALTRVWNEGLEGGSLYVISFDVRNNEGAAASSLTADANNYMDIFMNTDGATDRVTSTDEAPVYGVATAFSFDTNWKTVAFAFTYEESMFLALHFERLVAGTQITNFKMMKATKVYDIRLAEARISYAKQLMEMPEFNVAEAAAARTNLQNLITRIEGMIEAGTMEDVATSENMVNALDVMINAYMEVTTASANSVLKGLDGVAEFPAVGRGRQWSAGYIDNLELWGGNWGHTEGADYLMSAIQTGMNNEASYNVFNKDFPAGKYFFKVEIRNANTAKDSWPCPGQTFNLETVCKMYIGEDTINLDPISGEEYQRFCMVGDIKDAGAFRAGVIWPGPGEKKGGAFYVKNVEVRSFTKDLLDEVAHIQAWKAYAAQWNEAVKAHKQVKDLQVDGNYPWGRDSLQTARDKWGVYFWNQSNKGWMAEDGSDAGKATTEQLNEWAEWQGADPELGYKYQVVRGYQNAVNYSKALNAPLTTLADAIDAAKKTRNMAMNATGDRDAYKTAILAALATLNQTRANTTDATRVADSTTVTNAKDALDAATQTFLNSVTNKPLISIDFSNPIAPVEDGEGGFTYAVAGEGGSINFNQAVSYDEGTQTFNNDVANVYALGYNDLLTDVLRIGKGDAKVVLAEDQQPNENDMFSVQFDLWVGNLVKRFVYVQLLNAAGERVAGFSMNRYDGTIDYNDFNNAENTGLDILAKVSGLGSKTVSNDAICVDGNKSSFTLEFDYKNAQFKGSVVNGTNGSADGAWLPMREMDDTKIATIVIGSTYDNKDRRCWFDNLKVQKYQTADFEEDIPQEGWLPAGDGIETATVAAKANNAIYTISGQKVNGVPSKGLYIINGKKYVVK